MSDARRHETAEQDVREQDGRERPGRRVRLEPWSADDLWLLRRTNAPEMTEHLGGPETEEKLLDRHQRYQAISGDAGTMFRVLREADGEVLGSIGFWTRTWQDEEIYETGWGVLPEFQGQGVASDAARAVTDWAAAHGDRRFLHAFPSVGHPASNGVCRKAGFVFVAEFAFEYPKGNPIRCNDWRIDLRAPRG